MTRVARWGVNRERAGGDWEKKKKGVGILVGKGREEKLFWRDVAGLERGEPEAWDQDVSGKWRVMGLGSERQMQPTGLRLPMLVCDQDRVRGAFLWPRCFLPHYYA